MKMLSKVHAIKVAEFAAAMLIALISIISATILGHTYPVHLIPIAFIFGLFYASGVAYYFAIRPLKKNYMKVFAALNDKCINEAILNERISLLSGMLSKKDKESLVDTLATKYLEREYMDLKDDYDKLYEENEDLEKSLKAEKKKNEYLQIYCANLNESLTRAVTKCEQQVKANTVLSGRIFKLIDSLKEFRNWKKTLPKWAVDFKKVS